MFMVTTAIHEGVRQSKPERSYWSSMNLLIISGIMLIIGITWRMVDQFILNLGSTWMNIMPSKLFPFLIMIGFFWRYRRKEIDSVLGLSGKQFRAQFAAGLVMVLMISILIDIGGAIIYAVFLDPAYPLEMHILNPDLLGYMFIFFLTNAFFEETLFRGLLQNSLKTQVSPNKAIVLSAITFGLWHSGWPLVNGSIGTDLLVQVSMMVFFTTILGLLFGIYYERFSSGQSLIGAIIAHTFFNFISEDFKIGPEPVIQGPDLVFSTPGLMAVSLLMFLVVFLFLFAIFWRFRIEQAGNVWNRFREYIMKQIRDLPRAALQTKNENNEV
jgi:membrane protease YdiL (CAAX protease family)